MRLTCVTLADIPELSEIALERFRSTHPFMTLDGIISYGNALLSIPSVIFLRTNNACGCCVYSKLLWSEKPESTVLFVFGRGHVPFEIVAIYRKIIELSADAGCSSLTFDAEGTGRDFSAIAKRLGAREKIQRSFVVEL